MREIHSDEMKRIQVGILKSVAAFCDENNLKYTLIFGTLLGAVRHKGFIPWDDDVDICMPRADYERFFSLYNQNSENHLRALNCWNDDRYYLPFGKVIDTRTLLKENVSVDYNLGVYIDIFPVDQLSADPAENAEIRKKILFWRKQMMIKFNPGSAKRSGIKKLAHTVLNKLPIAVDLNKLARKIDRISQSFNDAQSGNLAIISNVDYYDIFREYDPELLSEREALPFEDLMCWGPKQYDKLLTITYGDYMQLPPEDQRLPHESEAWWKEGQ